MKKFIFISIFFLNIYLQADPPKNYYSSAIGKKGDQLRIALHDIIDEHLVIRYSSKDFDTADAISKLYSDPDNQNNVILIYSRRSEAILNFGTSNGWNREHIWPNSYGIDKRGPAYSDLHNLQPADASVNTSRSNKIYDFSDTKDANFKKPGHPEAKMTNKDSDSWEPPVEVRGDIARAVFYMDIRYNGDNPNEKDLILTNDLSLIDSDNNFFGKLNTLIKWHLNDPTDAQERFRNDLIFSEYQKNRNPFVDHPEWVEEIYGNSISQKFKLSSPKIDGESILFDLKLAGAGRYQLLQSSDLLNWTLVDDFETSKGIHQLKKHLFEAQSFFQIKHYLD
ncbi:endonuclease [Verrucomicrobia bacterium]|nr:endonuclease [Verrucomicrobiota bacterium]